MTNVWPNVIERFQADQLKNGNSGVGPAEVLPQSGRAACQHKVDGQDAVGRIAARGSGLHCEGRGHRHRPGSEHY